MTLRSLWNGEGCAAFSRAKIFMDPYEESCPRYLPLIMR